MVIGVTIFSHSHIVISVCAASDRRWTGHTGHWTRQVDLRWRNSSATPSWLEGRLPTGSSRPQLVWDGCDGGPERRGGGEEASDEVGFGWDSGLGGEGGGMQGQGRCAGQVGGGERRAEKKRGEESRGEERRAEKRGGVDERVQTAAARFTSQTCQVCVCVCVC